MPHELVVVFDTNVIIPMSITRAECMAELDRLRVPESEFQTSILGIDRFLV